MMRNITADKQFHNFDFLNIYINKIDFFVCSLFRIEYFIMALNFIHYGFGKGFRQHFCVSVTLTFPDFPRKTVVIQIQVLSHILLRKQLTFRTYAFIFS